MSLALNEVEEAVFASGNQSDNVHFGIHFKSSGSGPGFSFSGLSDLGGQQHPVDDWVLDKHFDGDRAAIPLLECLDST